MTTRETMRRAGYRAAKVLCQDGNGGTRLVDGWVIVKPGLDTPRPGEAAAGYASRQAAWHAAEDAYEQMQRWIER